LEPYYSPQKLVSVPVRIRRMFSPEFTEIVTLTGSDIMTHKMDRHERRNVEYYKVKSRNKQIKKFKHPNKVLVTRYTKLADSWVRAGRPLRMYDLTEELFNEIQAQITADNEAKIKEAELNPKYSFRIVQKPSSRKRESQREHRNSTQQNIPNIINTTKKQRNY
jgi:hypothetical protein